MEVPMFQQTSNTNIGGPTFTPGTPLSALGIAKQPTAADLANGWRKYQDNSFSSVLSMPDWWSFNTAPPPLVSTASDSSFMATATAWAAGSTEQNQVPAGFIGKGLTNVNIVVRGGPLLRFYSRGVTELSNTLYSAPPNGYVYLGSGSKGGVLDAAFPRVATLTPNGPCAAVYPAGMDDVVVLELPSSLPATDPLAPAHVFVTMTLAQIQAQRPGVVRNSRYNWFSQPVVMTGYDGHKLPVVMVADNGAEVTFLVGETLPNEALRSSATSLPGSGDSQDPFAVPILKQLEVYLFINSGGQGRALVNALAEWNGLQQVQYGLPLSKTSPDLPAFVRDVCGAPGFRACRSIVGTTPSTCLGAFTTVSSAGGGLPAVGAASNGQLGQACGAVCNIDTGNDAVGIACRAVISQHCNASGAGAGAGTGAGAGDSASGSASGSSSGSSALQDPACACALMNLSEVPVTVVAGQPMTFLDFERWFQTNFKGHGVPALIRNAACWWPACRGGEAALQAYTPCPADIQQCLALVQKVTATNDSTVSVHLRNQCGISLADTSPAALPPPPANAPAAAPSLQSQLGVIVLLGTVTLVVCLILLCSIGLVKKRR